MRLVLLTFGTLLLTGLCHAEATLTCTAPGFSYSTTIADNDITSCTFPAGLLTPQSNPSNSPPTATVFNVSSETSVTGNVFTTGALAFISVGPSYTSGPFPESISTKWNEIFELPTSITGDYYNVRLALNGLAGVGSLNFGPVADNVDCDIHYSGRCDVTGKVDASQVSSLNVSELFAPTIYQDFIGGGTANEFTFDFTADFVRFHADGMPADFSQGDQPTLTPEPSACLLVTVGMVMAGLFWRRQSRASDC